MGRPLATSRAEYTFANWASDRGYSPGGDPAEPDRPVLVLSLAALRASTGPIRRPASCGWTATRLTEVGAAFTGLEPADSLNLRSNQLTTSDAGAFTGLTESRRVAAGR